MSESNIKPLIDKTRTSILEAAGAAAESAKLLLTPLPPKEGGAEAATSSDPLGQVHETSVIRMGLELLEGATQAFSATRLRPKVIVQGDDEE